MKVKVSPPLNPIVSNVQLPVSKSVLNRYFCLLYLSGSPLPPVSSEFPNDVRLMHSLLQFSDRMLHAEDAGTVMRFGLALSCVTEGTWTLSGSERMHDRPISTLVDALRQLGANIEYIEKEHYPPLRVRGCKLRGGSAEVDASISSQFISALLMIAPMCKNAVEIVLTGNQVSSPYMQMTSSMMERFNVNIKRDQNVYRIEPQTYKYYELGAVLDWSAASFFYETMALSNMEELNFPGLFKTGLQGDERLSDLFEPLGIETIELEKGIKIVKKKRDETRVVSIDFIDVPDLVQPLVCTCFGLGIELHLRGLYNLHLKESDRLKALSSNLEKLGAELSFEHYSGLVKRTSKKLLNNELDAHKDHRMAMSLAPLCTKFGALLIDDAQTVTKSFPKFFNELTALGFTVLEIN